MHLQGLGNCVAMKHNVYIIADAQTYVYSFTTVRTCLLSRYQLGTVWTCVYTVQQLLCGQMLLVPTSFPNSLHLHVWFGIQPSISTKQPILASPFRHGIVLPLAIQFVYLNLGICNNNMYTECNLNRLCPFQTYIRAGQLIKPNYFSYI